MTEPTYYCARCGSPVHDYSDADQRAACETCTDWVPVKRDCERELEKCDE